MAGVNVVELGAVGSAGMATQLPEKDLNPVFAWEAINCTTDQGGRLVARYSVRKIAGDSGPMGVAEIVRRLYRHNRADGSVVMVGATASGLFRSEDAGETLVSLKTVSAAGAWQFASLNGKLYAVHAGQDFLSFDEGTWADSTISTPAQPKAIHAAYGRLWALSADGKTLSWSDLLDGDNWTSGASGSLDLSRLQSGFVDVGVAVCSFNNRIYVLCRNSVVILGLAANLNPNDGTTPIHLVDTVPNIGCVARDTVAAIGSDIYFLADDGLRSLSKSLQQNQGPAPLSDVSALNQKQIIQKVVRQPDPALNLTAAVFPNELWYLLHVPTSAEVWLFDLANKAADSALPVMTVWRMGQRPVYHATYWTNDALYFGGKGGVYDYSQHDATEVFNFVVETGWLSLGNGAVLKSLKQLVVNVTGGANQACTLKWYVDYDDGKFRALNFWLGASTPPGYWGLSYWGEFDWSLGKAINEALLQIGSSARYVKLRLEIPVKGSAVALNNVQVRFVPGRVR